MSSTSTSETDSKIVGVPTHRNSSITGSPSNRFKVIYSTSKIVEDVLYDY